MASGKTTQGTGSGGLLAGSTAPLCLPERALEALGEASDALRDIRSELAAMRVQTEPLGELVPLTKELREVVEPMPPTVERISAQAEPLDEMLPALERDEARLNKQVETLCGEIGDLKSIISGLKADVERITERLPDPTHGRLDKVRDVLSGGGQPSSGGGR